MGRYQTTPCGTMTGLRRHYRLGEKPCRACKDARNEANGRKVPVFPAPPIGWRDRAACAESDLDWFPDEDNKLGIALCEAVCEGCPVRGECLTAALAESSVSYDLGFRGGMTERERRALRRMLRASA